MLEALWLTPPIAVARLGSSDVICANFEWAANDAGPGGTGKTTLRAIDSLELDDDGTPREVPASDELVFKDRDADGTWHFRPVCPYFELHGTWTLDGQTTTGPVTTAVLEALGVQPSQVTWRIRLANLKAYQFTLNDGDRIECEETIAGDTTTKIALFATSPRGDRQFQLIPGGERIPVGAVQLANPNQAFPEIGYPLRSRDVNMLGWRTRHPIPKAGSTTRAP